MHLSNSTITQALLLLALNTGLVSAQDDADNTAAAHNEAKQQQENQQDAAKQKRPEVKTPDTFAATEQLSEDIAADFPVDI